MTRVLRMLCALTSAMPMLAFAVTGEQWEYTNQMNMPGMSMPARTMKVCKETGWDKPPESQQGQNRCQMGQFNRSGNTMTWDMKCPEGKAHGQMTFQGSDNFSGTTTFEGEHGTFTMNMSGHKTGTCEIAAGTGAQVEGAPSKEQIQELQRRYQHK